MDEPIEAEVCTATSCPSFLPFTVLPASWAGKNVKITLSEPTAPPQDLFESTSARVANAME